VLKTDAGLLPIDAKFPMEQFEKMHKEETEAARKAAHKAFTADVKKHITDISKKYIAPDEGTMDFALMYIPSEAIYYEVATNTELMNFTRKHRVYPVSPNTLYAHLQVLMLSFVGREMEQKSRTILKLLSSMKKDYARTEEYLATLNRHITNAYNGINTVTKTFTMLGQKISRAQELPEGKDEI
jgi:DNA recombination protein RmuC